MSRYLVTGAAGFIGYHISEELLKAGDHVVALDCLNETYDVRLKEWRLTRLKSESNLTACHHSICDREPLRALFESAAPAGGFDAVINLAAHVGVRQSRVDPWSFIETNVNGTLNLLELSRDFGVEKFVLGSTSSVYGAGGPQPFKEDGSTVGRPLSPYAASKLAAEALCHSYHHLYGLDVSVLRYFTVYGPAGRPDMSPFRFIQWISERRPVTIYGDGKQRRDFTYIDDAVAGTLAALRPLGYEIINLGSGRPIQLIDFLKICEGEIGWNATVRYEPHQPSDMSATWADIAKAKSLIGWQPQVEIEEGVRRLIGWYRENRDWASEIMTGPAV